MSHPEATPSRTAQRGLGLCLAAMVVLVALKFVALLADYDWDPSKAPWALLVVVIVPAVLLGVLVKRRPRIAAPVIGVLLALFIVSVVAALLRDGFARQSWADYPFAYGGLVVAALGIYYAAVVITARHDAT